MLPASNPRLAGSLYSYTCSLWPAPSSSRYRCSCFQALLPAPAGCLHLGPRGPSSRSGCSPATGAPGARHCTASMLTRGQTVRKRTQTTRSGFLFPIVFKVHLPKLVPASSHPPLHTETRSPHAPRWWGPKTFIPSRSQASTSSTTASDQVCLKAAPS